MAKVFISHSSADKELVDLFKNIILNAGLGIADEDIAYTSAVETGVPTGGNIPQYIKDNLADCDFVFFMISENYRKSEVCLNEMGAAWALDKKVKPILLYDVPFTSVGWLYSMNLCARIDDSERLDELRDDFAEKYQTCVKTVVWNKTKAEFLSKVAESRNSNTALVCVDKQSEDAEELGILDYREIFDRYMDLSRQITCELTEDMNQLNSNIETRTKQILLLNQQAPNPTQARGIMIGYANDMNKMADAINNKAPKLSEYFKAAVESASAMQKDSDAGTKQANREALNELIQSMVSAKDSIVAAQTVFSNIPHMEKTQIAAKKRLVKEYSTLIAVYDECITKATELLIA